MTDSAQIYLQTPEQFELEDFKPVLAKILAAIPVACLRISLTTTDPKLLGQAADGLREICHAHDVAIVMDDHFHLAHTHGLDGVHLKNGAKSIREAREVLGKDAIIGAFCSDSRHSGISAAEIGVEYVSFGPLTETGLGRNRVAQVDLFEWWSEMIETPVVAEGGLGPDAINAIKNHTDFICLGPEIWADKNPQAQLAAIIKSL